MKITKLTFVLILIVVNSFGQNYTFELERIRFRGLGIKTTKAEIISSFGHGDNLKTDYECGFFSIDQESAPFYKIVYNDFDFIGSDKEDFFYLNSVKFDPKEEIKLEYGSVIFTGLTTIDKFIELFGETVNEHFKDPKNDGIVLLSNESDDGARFTFKDGRLIRFEYWTPC